MNVGELCTREVIIAQRDTSVVEAAQRMRTYHVGNLVVVEDETNGRRPIGIVTDRDIVIAVVAAGVNPEALKVGDIMSAELVMVRETEDVCETLRYMRDKGVRRMPVVDAAGALAGIVTVDDLLGLLAEEMGHLAQLITRGQRREASARR